MKKTNINKGDFLISDLPRNRYALFFDILKNQWRSLLLMAVIILLLFLPIILLRFFNLVMINSVVNNGEGTNLKAEVFNTFVGYSIINFIVVVVVGILFGGVARIYKKLAFNEGFFLGADFIRGIKENFKDYFWLFLIYGLLNMLLEILCMNYMLDKINLLENKFTKKLIETNNRLEKEIETLNIELNNKLNNITNYLKLPWYKKLFNFKHYE